MAAEGTECHGGRNDKAIRQELRKTIEAEEIFLGGRVGVAKMKLVNDCPELSVEEMVATSSRSSRSLYRQCKCLSYLALE